MGILILILKIIGVLLAVLISLVAAVAAVPVRYRASVKVQDEIEGKAVFHWLLHAVDIRLCYGHEGLAWKCRILGIPILGQQKGGQGVSGRQKERQEGASRQEESKTTEESEKRKEEGSKDQAKKRVAKSIQRQKAEIVAFEEEQAKKEGRPATGTKIESESKEEAGDPGRLGRLTSFLGEGQQKVSAIKARIHNIKTLIFEETNQKAFRHILQEMKCLLHHFAPRKASGEMEFGMGDPAQTGEVLGIISFLPFWAKYQVAVTPDFMAESMYVRGELSGRGHIRICHLLPSGIRLFKDKNIHRLIAAIRQ
ncbi:MAG: DUF2953 domain-containing protein [Lachnospiraceae bacterium]|nr:DUF2953 domain-containing protein [Lachnospiraceae bacterium]